MTAFPPPRNSLAAIFLLTLAALPVQAQNAAEKGLEIAREIDRRDIGFGYSRAKLEMVLSNRNGQKSIRRLRITTLEVPNTEVGDKSLTVFDFPRDIKGTAFLSHTKILTPDDQWLYLPALKRVKRISSANKSGPFVGSEFAYEDLVSFEVKKYRYKWLRDEACGALQCAVTERYPLYENSGYSRQITWIDRDEYRIRKVEFYDRKSSLLKTLILSNFKQYLGQYWRPLRLEMTNQQTGKATTLVFAEYESRAGLSDRDFTASRLKRVR